MMHEKIKAYMDKLSDELEEYLDAPISMRTIEAICEMVECLEHVKSYGCMCSAEPLTPEEIAAWNAHMVNDDGTTGPHWTVTQTTDAARAAGVETLGVTPEEWNVTMNMMFSDYCKVAEKLGISKPDFYAHMARAFLFDKDGGEPEEKLAAYYHGIVSKD